MVKKAKSTAAQAGDSDEGQNLSTLAVSREIADRIRAVAKDNGATTLDITNQLLNYALTQAKVEIKVKTVVISPAASRR
jgi:hypothetical protein